MARMRRLNSIIAALSAASSAALSCTRNCASCWSALSSGSPRQSNRKIMNERGRTKGGHYEHCRPQFATAFLKAFPYVYAIRRSDDPICESVDAAVLLKPKSAIIKMSRQYTLQRAPAPRDSEVHVDYAAELNQQQL